MPPGSFSVISVSRPDSVGGGGSSRHFRDLHGRGGGGGNGRNFSGNCR